MTPEEIKLKIENYKRWARHVRESAAYAERRSDADRDYDRALRYDQEAKKLEVQLKGLESK